MQDFIFNTPTKIYFGKDKELLVGDILSSLKVNKVLLHYGMNSVIKSGLLDKIEDILNKYNISYIKFGGVLPNPDVTLVRKGIKLCLDNNIDFILAIGGGSVIDSAKAIAHGVANPDIDIWDIILGKQKIEKSLNKGAILTISAAGSEMSDSCVISDNKIKEKRGLCSPLNRLNFAICNPCLTYSVSPYQTACGIVDIAMHTIERYFDLGDAYLTDSLSESLIKTVFDMGKIVMKDPTNYEARANLMWASSLAHNGLTHAGKIFLLNVHQLEHELSALDSSIAHGAGLAALWCSWAKYVYKSNIAKWKRYATKIWDIDFSSCTDDEGINKAIDLQEQYYKELGMPISIKELGIKEEDLETLAFKCSREKTRILKGYKDLDYLDMLNIYKMSYSN